jgi:RNA polymerase sigma-70 factor (ECF subfamily)
MTQTVRDTPESSSHAGTAAVRGTEALSGIEAVQRGGQAALAEVFMGHRERLRRMVQLRMDRRVVGRVDASDVLQETFLDASRQLANYLADPPMSLFLWLRFLTGQRLMAIHRKHLGAQKRDARQEVTLHRPAMPDADSMSLSCGLLGQMTSPSMAAVRLELQVCLQQTVDGLEPLDREILALRHYEELTNQEAAEELGITTAAASKRYIRALERLRRELRKAPGLLHDEWHDE